MLFMISAYDSIAMYLAIEPQSLCFDVIAASKRKYEFSTEGRLEIFSLRCISLWNITVWVRPDNYRYLKISFLRMLLLNIYLSIS